MTLINLIGFQLVWLVCVGGAGQGLWWPGALAIIPFIAWELVHSEAVGVDLGLLAKVLALGFVLDSAFAFSGVLDYAADWPSPQLAPVWIMALWAAFAMALRRSLGWLMPRLRLAAALGAVFGPLSYSIAAYAWDAVEFRADPAVTLGLLAIAWGLATPLCLHWACASRSASHRVPAPLPARIGADKAENI